MSLLPFSITIMAFTLLRPSALARTEFYAKVASTAYVIGDLLAANNNATANTFVAATATTEFHLGVLQKTIASTDADYADETKVPILVDECGIWQVDVGTGTADVNDEQGYIDLKDTNEADVTAGSVDALFVVDFVSGTKINVKICSWAGLQRPVDS